MLSTFDPDQKNSKATSFEELALLYKNSRQFNPKVPFDIDYESKQFTNLLQALKEHKGETLLISIGSAGGAREFVKEQQIPSYLKEISKSKSCSVFIIDPVFALYVRPQTYTTYINRFQEFHTASYVSYDDVYHNKFHVDIYSNLNTEIFCCALPYNFENFTALNDLFTQAIKTTLDKKNQVFIANHTQAWSLDDIPMIASVYNNIKGSHPNADLLQLYTQGGFGLVRYYKDKLYNEELSQLRTDLNFYPIKDEFAICRNLTDLLSIDGFKPLPTLESKEEDKPKSPLIALSKFSTNSTVESTTPESAPQKLSNTPT